MVDSTVNPKVFAQAHGAVTGEAEGQSCRIVRARQGVQEMPHQVEEGGVVAGQATHFGEGRQVGELGRPVRFTCQADVAEEQATVQGWLAVGAFCQPGFALPRGIFPGEQARAEGVTEGGQEQGLQVGQFLFGKTAQVHPVRWRVAIRGPSSQAWGMNIRPCSRPLSVTSISAQAVAWS